jgi:hypothetical protein
MTRAAVLAAAVLLASCGSSTQTRDHAQRAPVQRFVAERTPWTFMAREGWEYATPGATIRTTLRDRGMLIRLPAFVELAQIHARTAIATLPPPEEPVTTYMLGSRREWEDLTRRLLGDRAGLYLAIERGGYSAGTTGVYYNIGPKDSFTIAAHEGWHQLAASVLKDPIPVWLDEGLACYLEGFVWDERSPDTPRFRPWANLERHDQLRDAHARGALHDLRTLVTSRPQDLMRTDKGADAVLTYYAQLWALIHFFKERGHSHGLERVVTLAHNGALLSTLDPNDARALRSARTGPGVLSVIAPGSDLDELDARFRRYVNEIVAVGGRNKILMGESPTAP